MIRPVLRHHTIRASELKKRNSTVKQMKVVFIVPYYGAFPNYFALFLKTCAKNPDYHWLIVSDIKKPCPYPDNVRQLELTWDALKALVKSKFAFPVSLEKPYKLCDFKPAYGYIFEQYIKEYDYWGHCDIDLLFGDLKRFLPFEKIQEFDKIGHLGHMTLYRNSEEINRMFARPIDGVLRYQEVFSTEASCVFDEWDWISINHLFLRGKKKVWMFDSFFDVYPNDDNFRRVERERPTGNQSYGADHVEKWTSFASWEEGKAFQWRYRNGSWDKTEVAYVHFQKRNMQLPEEPLSENILCVPDAFLPLEGETIPKAYLRRARLHTILNKKRIRWNVKKLLYWLIVKTSPIRHPFRRTQEKG